MILTRHHLWWPKSDYVTETEKRFRDLDVNIVLIPDCVHAILHKHQKPPQKPPVEYMEAMLDLYEPRRFE